MIEIRVVEIRVHDTSGRDASGRDMSGMIRVRIHGSHLVTRNQLHGLANDAGEPILHQRIACD